jgi:hypothetical protein
MRHQTGESNGEAFCLTVGCCDRQHNRWLSSGNTLLQQFTQKRSVEALDDRKVGIAGGICQSV